MKNHINTFLIAAAVVISACIFGGAWKKSHAGKSMLEVTGLATRDFDSDLIVWEASFSKKAMTLKDAYKNLKDDAEIIRRYLIDKEGLKESEIIFSAVAINKEFENQRTGPEASKQVFTGYNLTQTVSIESKNVEKIELVSRHITDLIDAGVELYSTPPRYYYTKLADLKIEMLASAAKDARQRADKIAENAGGKIEHLKSAEMGVFQITAPNSTEEYSWGGAFNTSSKKKTACITVKLEFMID
jgi:hypothetical protein